MPLFARSNARHVPPQKAPLDEDHLPVVQAADCVRVIRGEFAGLKGRVVSRSEPDRWLVATEIPGLALRIASDLLEPLPPA